MTTTPLVQTDPEQLLQVLTISVCQAQQEIIDLLEALPAGPGGAVRWELAAPAFGDAEAAMDDASLALNTFSDVLYSAAPREDVVPFAEAALDIIAKTLFVTLSLADVVASVSTL